jgi:hypothetical protein
MSPRAGGEASKFGARYEGVWTVRQLLEVLFGKAMSLTVERGGEIGKGVEFELRRPDGRVEVHQVKRQRGSANSWTLRALQNEGVLTAAKEHVLSGREFQFVSVIPSRRLDRLSDRARRSADLQVFVEEQLDGEGIRDDFDFLSSEAWESPQKAWEILRGVRARWPDERELNDSNIALAGVLLDGTSPTLAPLALGDLIDQNLGLALTIETVAGQMGTYDLRLDPLLRRTGVADSIKAVTRSWREGVAGELLDPTIIRTEGEEIVESLEGAARLIMATGNAGDGKSGVLHQVVDLLTSRDWPVLAIRLDRLESFTSPQALGEKLGLPVSPAAALGAVAGADSGLLLIDQLDAVSLASGRMPSSFDAVAELLREASAFPQIRVLMACRQFDIENDSRLRALVSEKGPAKQVPVARLSTKQVEDSVRSMDLDPSALSRDQLILLRSPLHLVLLRAIAGDDGALSFSTTKDLFDSFWDSKVRAVRRDRHPPPRFTDVIDALIDSMSASQRLAVPTSALDSDDLLSDADVMASEHVLALDGRSVAFFHETFFDYAFARRWITRGESLVQFLLNGEQELFRRAQVRQVLAHLRDEDAGRFAREVSEILACDSVRFQIKDVVLGLIRSLSRPSHEEWLVIEKLLARGVTFEERLWRSLRTEDWFDRLRIEGKMAGWLASEDVGLKGRAVDIMAAAVKNRPDQVAELLNGHSSQEGFPGALLWVTRFADLSTSRPLFDLLLEAVKSGRVDGREGDVWLDAHGLAEAKPEWAAELVAAFLTERPGRLRVGDDGKVTDLSSRDHGLLELVSAAAKGAPERFCELLVGYLLEVMAATREGSANPPRDRHFGLRIWRAEIHELDDALLYGARDAIVSLATNSPDSVLPFLRMLTEDPHDAAQWLLYEGLRASGPRLADWAAEVLLRDESRLYSGYMDSALWTTRELLRAISPVVEQSLFEQLEAMIVGFAPEWEKRGRGYSSFTLLTGLEEDRLSAHSKRRLGELRRLFDQEQPREPMGIRVQTVGSPIPESGARRMSDSQWLGAISRYSKSEHDRGIELRGGAEQLANVLEKEAKVDPDRFVRLALSFNAATNPAYSNAVLHAVAEPEVPVPPESVFELLRHIDGLGQPENDSWLGRALRRQMENEIPDDIIELIVDRALHSPDPESEAWLTESWGGQTYYGGDPWANGMNTARGAAAEALADLLVGDSDGRRSALVAPRLLRLAQDDSTAVRASVAKLISAALRYQRDEALEAFDELIRADDRLLSTATVERLIANVGRIDPQRATSTIERMLGSDYESVRSAGGRLAAYAGLEFNLRSLLEGTVHSSDPATRKGAATVCAEMVGGTSDEDAATNALARLFFDSDEGVRGEAAGAAMALRGADLGPHLQLLRMLISSPAFPAALAQLLITLEKTSSPIEELALLVAERFIKTHREEMSNIETRAAGDSRGIGELLLRAYSQSHDTLLRSRTLDLLDQLLELEAYGVAELVNAAER